MTWVMSVLILMESTSYKRIIILFELIQIVKSVDEKERFETVGGQRKRFQKCIYKNPTTNLKTAALFLYLKNPATHLQVRGQTK